MKFFNLVYRLFLKIGLIKPIYYINGPEILPPPLSQEEERELIAENTDKSRDKLIVHNLRLVVYIARKFDSVGINIEDLISIGTIGLIKAVGTFDAEKNIKLVTYASRCIENEILMFLRKKNRRKQEVSLDEPLNVDYDGNELLLGDILGTQDDLVIQQVYQREDQRNLQKALKHLDPKERMILKLRYGLGCAETTQKEIADQFGISQSYISRMEKKILQKLKGQLLED